MLLFAFSIAQVQALQNRYNSPQATVNFKFTTWNTEWLSCTNYGPTDEELQINNIVAVIKAMNSDIIALQEVGTSSSYTTIDTLVRRLGNEWAGSMVPTTNDNCGQNEGIIYKKAKVQLVSSSLITNGGSSYDWSSGRYPVLYNVNLLVNGTAIPVSFINIHAKAMSDATSYSRRKSASEALKTLLDGSTFNSKRVVLLGDFNDYLIGTQCSECSSNNSPYKNFMDDTSNYKCLTSSLYDTYYNSPVIDNIIISNELIDNYKVNTVSRETQATQSIPNYNNTTSDHVPVSASFSMTVGTTSCENITFSEAFASSLGDFTTYTVNGSQAWTWQQNYGAKISGYVSGVYNANEDWLISPAFNLSGKGSATLAFNHALNYCPSEADKTNFHTLWVSKDYNDGTPLNATWTQLAIPTMPSGNSWTFISSGNVQIPTRLMQSNVRFAFKYVSNSTVASTWEIKDITFNIECVSTNIPTEIKFQNTVTSLNKKIKINNQQSEPVTVYDLTGRILVSLPSIQNVEIPIYQSGVYIVRVGNNLNKVIVR